MGAVAEDQKQKKKLKMILSHFVEHIWYNDKVSLDMDDWNIRGESKADGTLKIIVKMK